MNCRRIVVILDESGSMSGIQSDVITGMNDFITEQKKVEPEANDQIKYTFVKFSTNVYPIYDKPFNQVKLLTSRDYIPSGSTALFDAIGQTFETIKDEKNVAVMIVTDGQENSSTTYDRKQVFAMIKDLELKNNWKFAYLSSDIDTWQQGNTMGFSNTAQFSKTASGYSCERGGKQNQIVDYQKLGNQIGGTYNNCSFAALRKSAIHNSSNDVVVENETEKNFFGKKVSTKNVSLRETQR